MMPGDEAPTTELPADAVQAIWRIFGNGLAPLKEPVAEMIIDGIRVELSGTSGIGNHDTAFWAMGSINPDLAASIIRSSWSPEQMDSFARYAVDTLERLHGQGEIFDPKHVVGRNAQRARAHSVEVADDDLLRSFHVGSYIAFEAHRSMYPGIPSVVHLLLALKPEMLPELVGRMPDRLLQSLAAFCVGGIPATSDHRKPLQWITDSSPRALIALTILHVLEFARQAEIVGPTGASPSGEDASAPTTLEGAIGDLVSSLEALGPARATWWAFETYESIRVRPMSIAPWARTVWPAKSGGSVQAELLPGVLAHHTSYNAPFDSGLGQRVDGVPGAGCVVMRIP